MVFRLLSGASNSEILRAGTRFAAWLPNEQLSNLNGLSFPVERGNFKRVYHIYAIRLEDRETVISE